MVSLSHGISAFLEAHGGIPKSFFIKTLNRKEDFNRAALYPAAKMLNQVQPQDSPQTASIQIPLAGCGEAVPPREEPLNGKGIFAKRTQFRSTLHVKLQECPSQTNPISKPHGPGALGCIYVHPCFTFPASRFRCVSVSAVACCSTSFLPLAWEVQIRVIRVLPSRRSMTALGRELDRGKNGSKR